MNLGIGRGKKLISVRKQNTNRLIGTENKLMVARVEGFGRMGENCEGDQGV